jgi:hypothetical protein
MASSSSLGIDISERTVSRLISKRRPPSFTVPDQERLIVADFLTAVVARIGPAPQGGRRQRIQERITVGLLSASLGTEEPTWIPTP